MHTQNHRISDQLFTARLHVTALHLCWRWNFLLHFFRGQIFSRTFSGVSIGLFRLWSGSGFGFTRAIDVWVDYKGFWVIIRSDHIGVVAQSMFSLCVNFSNLRYSLANPARKVRKTSRGGGRDSTIFKTNFIEFYNTHVLLLVGPACRGVMVHPV